MSSVVRAPATLKKTDVSWTVLRVENVVNQAGLRCVGFNISRCRPLDAGITVGD